MKANLTTEGATLVREAGDRRIYKESTVGFYLKKLLNAQGYKFTRMYPCKNGLTSCRLGLRENKQKFCLWHERYAVENAAKEFNLGSVFFRRTDD